MGGKKRWRGGLSHLSLGWMRAAQAAGAAPRATRVNLQKTVISLVREKTSRTLVEGQWLTMGRTRAVGRFSTCVLSLRRAKPSLHMTAHTSYERACSHKKRSEISGEKRFVGTKNAAAAETPFRLYFMTWQTAYTVVSDLLVSDCLNLDCILCSPNQEQ